MDKSSALEYINQMFPTGMVDRLLFLSSIGFLFSIVNPVAHNEFINLWNYSAALNLLVFSWCYSCKGETTSIQIPVTFKVMHYIVNELE